MSQGYETCLVTGGAGFIGCALSQRLASMFTRVIALDSLHPQVHATRSRPAALHPAVELVVADATNAAAWDQIGATCPDVVVHLAAETGTGQSLTEASRHGLVNVVGTTRLLDALMSRWRARPAHIVLASSRAIYGEGAWMSAAGTLFYPGQRSHAQLAVGQWDFPGAVPTPMTASRTEPRPTSVYGATKLAQEHVMAAWCRACAVPYTIFRFQNVYGPGQSLTNPYTGVVSLFCQLAREAKVIPVYEDGNILRDFVFVEDVADAIATAIERPPPALQTLDIGCGAPTALLDLARLIAAMYAAPPPAVVGRYRAGDVRHAWADTSAAEEALGWTPRWSLAAGLRALQAWIEETAATGQHRQTMPGFKQAA